MMKKLMVGVNILIIGILTVQLAGCGTIMYPERKGQKAGKLDAGVVVLDGIGLLFFLIPGVIAFAVDFNNGTIYLPGSSRASLNQKDLKLVKFDPKHSSSASIERMIKNETGQEVKLDQDNIKIIKLKSTDEIVLNFNNVLPEIRSIHIALLK